MGQKSMTYAESGVHVDAGDALADLIGRDMRKTFGPRVLGKQGGFPGCFRLDYNEKLFQRNFRDPVLVSCARGVGSKVKLASQLGIMDTIGQDCVAMNVNELIVGGAEPLFFLDYLGMHKVDPPVAAAIVRGVADGCQTAGCALMGGETAEMPSVYAPGEFDLAGFAVGVREIKRIIDGSDAQPDDIILGLASNGIHANGYALVNAIVREEKLDLNAIHPEVDSIRPLGQVLLTPTRIYARSVISVLHSYSVKRPVTAMSHIAGEGIAANILRTLDAGLDARIDRNAWEIPAIFKFIQNHGSVADDEMFRVFNMGVGYIMTVRPWFAESIIHQLRRHGEHVYVLGKMVKGAGRVVIG